MVSIKLRRPRRQASCTSRVIWSSSAQLRRAIFRSVHRELPSLDERAIELVLGNIAGKTKVELVDLSSMVNGQKVVKGIGLTSKLSSECWMKVLVCKCVTV